MAVLPSLAQKYSKEIIENLLNTSKTIKELNESFIEHKNLSISTATVYRRVKELYLAGLLERHENGAYTVTERGIIAYKEMYGTKIYRSYLPGGNKVMLGQLSAKEYRLLYNLQNKQSHTSGLLQSMIISPNHLLILLQKLLQLQLIQLLEHSRKKQGRPKKTYQLTPLGKQILRELEELKEKLSRNY